MLDNISRNNLINQLNQTALSQVCKQMCKDKYPEELYLITALQEIPEEKLCVYPEMMSMLFESYQGRFVDYPFLPLMNPIVAYTVMTECDHPDSYESDEEMAKDLLACKTLEEKQELLMMAVNYNLMENYTPAERDFD